MVIDNSVHFPKFSIFSGFGNGKKMHTIRGNIVKGKSSKPDQTKNGIGVMCRNGCVFVFGARGKTRFFALKLD